MNADVSSQLKILRRGIVDAVWADMEAPLRAKLELGRPLRIKCGFDPTAPDLHLGHSVVMNKMRQFQELGHQVTFLCGDFTAMIGDPTGKSQTRPPLSREQIEANAKTYRDQVNKILDPQTTQFDYNSRWLGALKPEELIKLAAKYTVARMMERNDFKSRYTQGQSIAVHEFLYPLMQAYDSVAMETDVELGGNDQLFNLMVGREIMREYGKPPQVILTVPLLVGLDGHLEDGVLVGDKMSKSTGNYIGLTDPAAGENGMFGKMMSISDPLMWHYYELLSDIDADELARRRAGHPKEAKRLLALEITTRYCGEQAAQAATEEFDRLHPAAGADRGVPDDVETIELKLGEPTFLSKLLVDSGLAKSNGEARRLIAQGGVHVDGERQSETTLQLEPGNTYLIKAGKRRFRRVVLN